MSPRPRTAPAAALALAAIAALAAIPPPANAQPVRRDPHIGYLYPAGAQRGATLEIIAGGQFLERPQTALVSGEGIAAAIVRHERPMPQNRLADLREKIEEVRKAMAENATNTMMQAGATNTGTLAAYFAGRTNLFPRATRAADQSKRSREERMLEDAAAILKSLNISDDEIRAFVKAAKMRRDPKRQENRQIEENVILRLTVATNAPPGVRELRLLGAAGLSNPIAFRVGPFPEVTEPHAEDPEDGKPITVALPAVINGQLLPGTADRYAFSARGGSHIVAAVQARALVPYLADAVPGWIQPVLTLRDERGRETAFADDLWHNPDPILACAIPATGGYTLEIRDALYRGREDFVYRITLGVVPAVTSVFPLGAMPGAPADLLLTGWNLPAKSVRATAPPRPGIVPVTACVPFDTAIEPALDLKIEDLPGVLETEPNDPSAPAQSVAPPAVVNGRIDAPGDTDCFTLQAAPGAKFAAEVTARRLGSPLDAWIRVFDGKGGLLAKADDCPDRAAGLVTHQADPAALFTVPNNGAVTVEIGDAQNRGGPEFGYRLRLAPPEPRFDVFVTPASINGRSGACVPVTFHAVRRDGFDGDIDLAITRAPAGCVLSGGRIPANCDKVRATITLGADTPKSPEPVAFEATGQTAGTTIRRPVTAAEEMMQAFLWLSLVPARETLVWAARGGVRPLQAPEKVSLVPGAASTVHFSTGPAPTKTGATLELDLSEPPEGVTIEKFEPDPDGYAVTFRADGAKAKPGQRGNLILEARLDPPNTGKKPADRNRKTLVYLPALPYEISTTRLAGGEPGSAGREE